MKTCILIGPGAGLGAALARTFGREGYALALIDRSAESLAKAERELDGLGLRARGYAADPGDEHALQHALRRAEAELGPAGVLLCHAAGDAPGPVLTLGREALVDAFRAGVAGALTAAQTLVPGMRARGRGTILFAGGGLSPHPAADHAALAVAKAGLRALALSLSAELATDGVHAAVVTVGGAVKTGTSLDPDRVAAVFLELHRQERAAWESERLIHPD